MPVAIAALGAAFLALLALAIMESAQVFSRAVASIFRGWHISIGPFNLAFGAKIAAFVEEEAGNGIAALESFLDSHVEPLVDVIRGPSNGPKNVIAKILGTIAAAATALRFIRTNRIPALINLVNVKFHDAEHYAHLLASENYNRILHYYNEATAHTDHYFKAAIAHADAAAHDAKHYAHAADVKLYDEIIHYYGLAQQHADDDLNKALHRADVVKVAAETFTIGAIATAVHQLDDVISHRLAPVQAEADGAKKKLATWLNECGDDLCEGLHEYSKQWPKVLNLVRGVVFLGFIEEMIREPERTAQDTYDVAGPIFTETMNLFRDLVGV